mmetsp:Transcript_6196/g.15335  ORF Transcript_6196/g.15335 Transcript_6196/m.15335 type:complete len:302 (+) Transcript_6196:189-1094(+)
MRLRPDGGRVRCEVLLRPGLHRVRDDDGLCVRLERHALRARGREDVLRRPRAHQPAAERRRGGVGDGDGPGRDPVRRARQLRLERRLLRRPDRQGRRALTGGGAHRARPLRRGVVRRVRRGGRPLLRAGCLGHRLHGRRGPLLVCAARVRGRLPLCGQRGRLRRQAARAAPRAGARRQVRRPAAAPQLPGGRAPLQLPPRAERRHAAAAVRDQPQRLLHCAAAPEGDALCGGGDRPHDLDAARPQPDPGELHPSHGAARLGLRRAERGLRERARRARVRAVRHRQPGRTQDGERLPNDRLA